MAEARETKGKYGALIQKAREPESRKSGKLVNQKAGKPDEVTQEEKAVNLCVKVPESWRRHWAAESKRHGITMTEVIVEALSDRFGMPD